MKLFKLCFLSVCCFFISNTFVNAQCAITNYTVSEICCEAGVLKVTGSFTIANGSGSYSAGIGDNNFINPATFGTISSTTTDGTINFVTTFPNFTFADNGGNGVFIQDNNNGACTGGTAMGTAPLSAGACATCAAAPPAVAQAPIPTMSQWGLLIFGLLVLNLGVIFLYRKQTDFIK